MKDNTTPKKVKEASLVSTGGQENYQKIISLGDQLEDNIYGIRGAPERRKRFWQEAYKYYTKIHFPKSYDSYEKILEKKALGLASMVNKYYNDTFGYRRGDYLTTKAIDYISPKKSKNPPFHDMGGAGLALIVLHRKRVYSGHVPSYASTYYLIGRNENGTFFSHPVSKNVKTVEEACQWIWNGYANNIIQRQGNIALISGAGPQIPASGLPKGHRIVENLIIHEKHSPIRYPEKGERIIIGKRAYIFV